jgi:hypothetical protein
MQNMPIYQALAQSFAAERVTAHFALMGDGNMHWATAMKNLDGYVAQDTAEVWSIHVSDRVASPSTCRTVSRGHGRM